MAKSPKDVMADVAYRKYVTKEIAAKRTPLSKGSFAKLKGGRARYKKIKASGHINLMPRETLARRKRWGDLRATLKHMN